MEYSEKVVTAISEAVVTALRRMIADYNRTVDTKMNNIQITGDNIKPLSINNTHIKEASIDVAKVKNFTSEVANIAVANIENATIDTAQIRNLAAYVAQITVATIESAEITWAEIANLSAAVAEIAIAEIGRATIKYAQIEGLTAGSALITEMVGGKVGIADLAVTDANIVELNANKITAGTLSVERLVIVGDEKSIVYAINEANGTTQLSQTTIDGGSITRKTITADQIVAQGITAECLNVTEIFANEALIGAIKTANLDATEITSNSAFISQLTTSMVKSPEFAGLNLVSSEFVKLEIKSHVPEELKNTSVTITKNGIGMTGGQINMEADTAINIQSGGKININADSSLKVASGGNVDINGGSLNVNADSTMTVKAKGALVLDGGSLEVKSGSELNVSGGKVNVTADSDLSIASGKVLNIASGTINMASGSELKLAAGGNLVLDGGSVDVNSGSTMNIKAGGSLNLDSGSMSINSGSTLDVKAGGKVSINGGELDIASGSMNIAAGGSMNIAGGSVALTSGGLIDVTGGTVNINAGSGLNLKTGGELTIDSGNFSIDASGNVTMEGTITSKDGEIGGWSIEEGALYSGSSDKHVRLSTGDSTYAIWAGAEASSGAPFRVARDGAVYLTKLYVTDEDGNAQATPVDLRSNYWKMDAAYSHAVKTLGVSDNILTIELYNGTIVNFKKASDFDGIDVTAAGSGSNSVTLLARAYTELAELLGEQTITARQDITNSRVNIGAVGTAANGAYVDCSGIYTAGHTDGANTLAMTPNPSVTPTVNLGYGEARTVTATTETSTKAVTLVAPADRYNSGKTDGANSLTFYAGGYEGVAELGYGGSVSVTATTTKGDGTSVSKGILIKAPVDNYNTGWNECVDAMEPVSVIAYSPSARTLYERDGNGNYHLLTETLYYQSGYSTYYNQPSKK